MIFLIKLTLICIQINLVLFRVFLIEDKNWPPFITYQDIFFIFPWRFHSFWNPKEEKKNKKIHNFADHELVIIAQHVHFLALQIEISLTQQFMRIIISWAPD